MLKRPAAACFFLAVLVRMAYVLFSGSLPYFPDEGRFLSMASSFADHFEFDYFKLAHDMPLTSVADGVILWCGGDKLAIRLIQCLVSALTVLPACSIARCLHPSRCAEWLSGLCTAFYPFFIFYSGTILSETWFVFFCTAYFANVLHGMEWGKGVWSGVSAGLAHLTRPTLLLFLPVSAAWVWLTREGALKRILVAAAVFSVLVTPWIVRNYQVFGVFMITSTGGGQNLWDANNPWNDEGGIPPQSGPNAGMSSRQVPKDMGEVELDRHLTKMALDFLKEDPARTARLMVHKFFRFWNLWPNADGFNRGLYKVVALLSFGPVLALGLLCPFVLRERWREWGLIFLFIGYYTALHLVAMASIRYRLPLEPLLIACAAACAARLWERMRGGRNLAGEG